MWTTCDAEWRGCASCARHLKAHGASWACGRAQANRKSRPHTTDTSSFATRICACPARLRALRGSSMPCTATGCHAAPPCFRGRAAEAALCHDQNKLVIMLGLVAFRNQSAYAAERFKQVQSAANALLDKQVCITAGRSSDASKQAMPLRRARVISLHDCVRCKRNSDI